MKTLIDINALFGLLACRAGQALLLRPSQVNKLKLADRDIDGVPQILRLNRQAENTVRTRAKIVEIVTGKDSITGAILIEIKDFLWCGRFKNI